jgi:hypothetical protein
MKKAMCLLVILMTVIPIISIHGQVREKGNNLIIFLGDTVCFYPDKYDNMVISAITIYEDAASTRKRNEFDLFADSFPALNRLELDNVHLSEIHILTNGKTALEKLVIRDSPGFNLESQINQLKRIPALSNLTIEGANSPQLPSNLNQLKNLNEMCILNCDGLDIEEISQAAHTCRRLSILNLSGNNIYDSGIKNKEIPQLEKIIISDNDLEEIPSWVFDREDLQYLDISGNQLSLSDEFYKLRRLEIDSLVCDISNIADTAFVRKMFPRSVLIFIYNALLTSTDITIAYNGSDITEMEPVITESTKNYSSLISPTPNTSVTFDNYTAKANDDQTFYTKSGSEIKIPAGSLVYDDGSTVQGNYQLHFRELNDPADIFFSGAPMVYDSGGEKNIFQSSGMFEIFASQDEKQLKLKEGKSITINLPSVSEDKDFNLYKYNEETEKWEFTDLSANQMTRSYINGFLSNRSFKWREFVNTHFPFDTLKFDERYTDLRYARLKRISYSHKKTVKYDFAYFRMKRQKPDEDMDRKAIYFMLPDPDKSDFAGTNIAFLDINNLRAYTWIYKGTLSKMDFYKTYCRGKRWIDARVDYNESRGVFEIELKSATNYVSLEAVPVLKNIKNEGKLPAAYEKIDKRYDQTLEKIETRFDKKLQKKIDHYKSDPMRYRYDYINTEEYKDFEAAWNEYYINEKNYFDTAGINMSNVVRSLTIDGFGLWNCDKIFQPKNYPLIMASVLDSANNEINAISAFVIDKKRNTVVPAETGNHYIRFYHDRLADCAVCFIDASDNLYVIPKETYQNLDNRKDNITIQCEMISDPDKKSFHAAIGF